MTAQFPPLPGSFHLDFRGLDVLRARDCIVFWKDESHVVCVDNVMVSGGWPGGQGVQYIDSDIDEPVVTYSQGHWGGFLVWGSNESADQWNAMTGNQLAHPMSAVMFAGSCIISTSTYERYTYASRVGAGPTVPLEYKPSDPLYFSRRGRWTKEDEMTLAGEPIAAFPTGFVAQAPSRSNTYFLGIQTTL